METYCRDEDDEEYLALLLLFAIPLSTDHLKSDLL